MKKYVFPLCENKNVFVMESTCSLNQIQAYGINLVGLRPVKIHFWHLESCMCSYALPVVTSCWESAYKGFSCFYTLLKLLERCVSSMLLKDMQVTKSPYKITFRIEHEEIVYCLKQPCLCNIAAPMCCLLLESK